MSVSSGIFIILSRNLQNRFPCSDLVKWSANIYSVGQCSSLMSPLLNQSLINKYRTLMCFVLFVLDFLLLVSNSVALRLSWYMISYSIRYPCSSQKYFVQSICGIALSGTITSALVEMSSFSFFFSDILIANPPPRDIVPGVSLHVWVYRVRRVHPPFGLFRMSALRTSRS